MTAIAMPDAPLSPLHGVLSAVGSGGSNGLVHLRNPVGSGKVLAVWEARVQGDLFVSDPPHRMRITGTPAVLGGGGVRTTAAESRLDERDVTTEVGVLEAFNFFTTPFDDTQSEWAVVPVNTANGYGPNIVQDWFDGKPIQLAEGWAIEFETPLNGGSNERVYLVWDEVGPNDAGGPT